MSGIIGKKMGMGQLFKEDGIVIPVTFVLCEANEIIQIKNDEKDNAEGMVLGAFPLKKPRKTKKFKVVRQFSLGSEEIKKGDQWTLQNLGETTQVTIVGTSKGKGFQGGVKRHNFNTARTTHGTKEARHGSTGSCAKPNRTKKGLRMAGHMGNERITLHKKEIVKIDHQNSVVAIKGSIPGAINSTIILKTV